MESFFSRYRNALVLIVVLVAQLMVLAIQAKRPAADGADRPAVSLMRYAVVTVITPPERLVQGSARTFRRVWFGYIDLIHVRRDNANLRQELERLRLEQASIAQDAEQGRRLQHMLGFSEHYIYKTLPAQVIGTGGTDQSQVVYIDKGAEEGLEQDMPVITADGIVGKVKDVFPHTSQVLLVTDPTSGVGVILENTRIRGILKGRAHSQLEVADVSPDSRIKSGDTIVTSGGDQIFPRGLAVGTVDTVVPDSERDPLVDVLVHPAAKLSQLEEVLVITNLSDAISPQQAKDLAESEAEGEAEQKRASDVLAERLPSRIDPNAPADTNPQQIVDAAGNSLKAAPPKPAHPDGFSPNSEPDAAEMVPGQRYVPVKEGTEETAHPKPSLQTAPATTAAPATGSATPTAAPTATGTAPAHSPAAVASHSLTPAMPKLPPPPKPDVHPAALQTQTGTHVVVDGPENSAHKAITARPETTPSNASPKPEIVPNDGSAPPSTAPVNNPPAPETQQTNPPPGGIR